MRTEQICVVFLLWGREVNLHPLSPSEYCDLESYLVINIEYFEYLLVKPTVKLFDMGTKLYYPEVYYLVP